MSTYTDKDGNKYTYPASAIWKVGIPVVLGVCAIVVWMFFF